MKKITLSVAALAIAISSYGQNPQFGVDSTNVTNVSLEAKSQHENLYEIIMSIILLAWIIVGISNNMNRVDGHKKCCVKTAQEVYEYEGWIVK